MSFFTVMEMKGRDKPGFMPVIVHCDGTDAFTILKCGHTNHTEPQARKCLNMAFSYPLVQEQMRKGEPYVKGIHWIPNEWIKRGKGPACPNSFMCKGKKMDIHDYPTQRFFWCTNCGHDSRDENKSWYRGERTKVKDN